MIDESIFREYDIRGIVPSQINEHSIKLISHAIAQKCNDENIDELALGRDGRLSGEKILNLLSKELQSIGIDVVNIGIVTSPLLYFAAKKLPSKSGIMITGSHNPKNYNGFKIVINDVPISGLEIPRFAFGQCCSCLLGMAVIYGSRCKEEWYLCGQISISAV